MGAAFKEYANYDALGLAELIAAKTVSPQEVLEAALHRIEKLNPVVNAVSVSMSDIAREQVKKGFRKVFSEEFLFCLRTWKYRICRAYPRKLGHACLKTTSPQAPAMR